MIYILKPYLDSPDRPTIHFPRDRASRSGKWNGIFRGAKQWKVPPLSKFMLQFQWFNLFFEWKISWKIAKNFPFHFPEVPPSVSVKIFIFYFPCFSVVNQIHRIFILFLGLRFFSGKFFSILTGTAKIGF